MTFTDMLIESAQTKVGRTVGGVALVGGALAAARRLRTSRARRAR